MCVCVCVCVREREWWEEFNWVEKWERVWSFGQHAQQLTYRWKFQRVKWEFWRKKKDEKTKIGVNYVLILSGTFYLQKFLFHYMSRIFCSYFSNPNKSNMCSVNALWAAYLYMQVWSLALTCKSLWWNSSILTTLKRDGLTMDWAAVWHLVWESVGTRQFHVLHHGGKLFTKTCH